MEHEFYHHTKTKGDLGVLAAKLDVFKQGYITMSPDTEHAPFDFVAYKEGKFLRIQAKSRTTDKNGAIVIKLSTCWEDKNGIHTRLINKNDVDIICVYCIDNEKCYYFDPKLSPRSFTIRMDIAKNSQKSGIHSSCNLEKIPV